MKQVAAIQMASGPNVKANLTEAGKLMGQAAQAGAEMVVLPENFAIMGLAEQDKLRPERRLAVVRSRILWRKRPPASVSGLWVAPSL